MPTFHATCRKDMIQRFLVFCILAILATPAQAHASSGTPHLEVATGRTGQVDETRPLFQLPVQCSETWRLSTYIGHDDYDIDMTPTEGAASGRPILASFAGTVVTSTYGTSGGTTLK